MVDDESYLVGGTVTTHLYISIRIPS
jgi:hypothetical protein